MHAFPAIDHEHKPAPAGHVLGGLAHVGRHCLQRPSEFGMPHEVPNLHGLQPDVLPVLIWVRKAPCINHHHLVTDRGMSRCAYTVLDAFGSMRGPRPLPRPSALAMFTSTLTASGIALGTASFLVLDLRNISGAVTAPIVMIWTGNPAEGRGLNAMPPLRGTDSGLAFFAGWSAAGAPPPGPGRGAATRPGGGTATKPAAAAPPPVAV